MQAMVRSALTRLLVCRMVEQLIADLLADQASKEDEADRLRTEEEERLKYEEEVKVAEEARRKAAKISKLEEAERFKAEEEEERLKSEEEGKAAEEARRKAAKDKKAAEEAKAAAKRNLSHSKAECFIGPLRRPIGLLPEWWLEHAPHFTLDMDTFDEQMEELWQAENTDAAIDLNNQSWTSEYDYDEVTAGTLNESETNLAIEVEVEPE
jgi:hypothetical protein